MKTLFALSLLAALNFGARANELTVVTYNMGQLRSYGLDIVPCTSARLYPQLRTLGEIKNQHPYVAILLQEVWTQKAFNALRSFAAKEKLSMIPRYFSATKKNGLVTLSTLPLVEEKLWVFKAKGRDRKGIRTALATLPDGQTVRIANTHTSYSDSRQFKATHRSHFEEIGEFFRARDNTPLIFGGDLNAGHNISFRKQRYPASVEIWHHGLLPIVEQSGMKFVSQMEKNTWDMQGNRIASHASFWVSISSWWSLQTWGWEENSSVLDHILASEGVEVLEKGVVLNEKASLNCPLRDGGQLNLANLSDHYGSLVRLRLP